MRAQFKWDQNIIFLAPLATGQNFFKLRSHGVEVEGQHSIGSQAFGHLRQKFKKKKIGAQ